MASQNVRATWVPSIALLSVFFAVQCFGEDAAVSRIARDLRYLASDDLEGRGVGTDGLTLAKQHIVQRFKSLGLQPGNGDSYEQPFSVLTGIEPKLKQTTLTLHGPQDRTIELKIGADWQPMAIGGAANLERVPIVFAGYGISADDLNYNDYKDVDVKGKVVLIIRREPQQGDKDAKFDGTNTTRHSYINTKIRRAKEAGAKAILMVNDPFSVRKDKRDTLVTPHGFGFRSQGMPYVHLSHSVANQVLQQSPIQSDDTKLDTVDKLESHIDEHFQPMTQPLPGWTIDLGMAWNQLHTDVSNVIAKLPGDGDKQNEFVVIGGHYDHLGMGGFGSRRPNVEQVHNGADDNASGTTAVLELARRYAQQPNTPRRTILFMLFSAEERGLLGSNYYVANPLYPLANTIAMINFDMVGRIRDDKLTVYGTHTGKQFADLVDAAGQTSDLKLDKVRYIIGASDHFGFFKKQIPVIHFYSGFTDEYHTPDDDFETINVSGIARVVDYAKTFVDKVVDLDERPEYVKVPLGKRRPR